MQKSCASIAARTSASPAARTSCDCASWRCSSIVAFTCRRPPYDRWEWANTVLANVNFFFPPAHCKALLYEFSFHSFLPVVGVTARRTFLFVSALRMKPISRFLFASVAPETSLTVETAVVRVCAITSFGIYHTTRRQFIPRDVSWHFIIYMLLGSRV
jgi:hypothetical protein